MTRERCGAALALDHPLKSGSRPQISNAANDQATPRHHNPLHGYDFNIAEETSCLRSNAEGAGRASDYAELLIEFADLRQKAVS